MRAAILRRIVSTALWVAVLFFSSGPLGFRMGPRLFADDLERLIQRIEDARNPREVLGLGPNESDEETVKKAFRRMVNKVHPDKVTDHPELRERAEHATEKLLDSKDAILAGKLANWERNWNDLGSGPTASGSPRAKAKPGPRAKPTGSRSQQSRASSFHSSAGHSNFGHHARKSQECSEFYARFVIREGIPLAVAAAAATLAIHPEDALGPGHRPAATSAMPDFEPAAVAFPLSLSLPPSPSPLSEPRTPETGEGALGFCSRFTIPEFRERCRKYAAGRSEEELEFCGDFQIPAFQEDCFADLRRRPEVSADSMKSCRQFILPTHRAECLDQMERRPGH